MWGSHTPPTLLSPRTWPTAIDEHAKRGYGQGLCMAAPPLVLGLHRGGRGLRSGGPLPHNAQNFRRHSLPPQKVSEVVAPTAMQEVPYRITAAGLHGKASLVCGYNAAKGSRQCSRVPWEGTVAPQAEPGASGSMGHAPSLSGFRATAPLTGGCVLCRPVCLLGCLARSP